MAKKPQTTRVVYVNLPTDLADRLKEDADREEREISTQAVWIIKKHYAECEITREDLDRFLAAIAKQVRKCGNSRK
jgi:hypothetical protein